ncbi:MAG: GAF domain-containing sensor histidine kinase [Calditrichia bacterium]
MPKRNYKNNDSALSEISDLARRLASLEESSNTRQILQNIAESAHEVLKADLVELYEYNHEQQKYELPPISVGEKLDSLVTKQIYPTNSVWLLINESSPLFLKDAQASDQLSATYSPERKDRKDLPAERFVLRQKIKSTAAVPLWTKNESVGLMFANYRTKQNFTSYQRELIEVFASHAAIAIRNVRLFQKVQEQSQALTEQSQALWGKAQALTELNKLAHRLVFLEKSPDSRRLLQDIAESAKDVLKADLIELYEYQQNQDKYNLPPISVGKRLDDLETTEIYPSNSVWRLITESRPLYARDAQKSNRLSADYSPERKHRKDLPVQRFVVRQKIRSTAVIPLRTLNESMGLMFANYRLPQAFSKEQKDVIELFASHAAIAIKNVRLYSDVNMRRKALIQIGKELSAKNNVSEMEVLEFVYNQASELLNMENMSFALYDEPLNTVRFAIASLNGRRIDVKSNGWEPRRGGSGKTERVIKSKKYLLLSTEKEVRSMGFSPIPQQKNYRGPFPSAWLGVPMILGDKVFGVIANEHYGQDYFYNEDDVEVLQALADQAAIAIENARYQQKLTEKNQELNEAYEKLTEVDKRKSEFLSTVSHELRTPLTTVKGCIENVLSKYYGPITKKQKSRLEMALASVNDETRLVENLLELVRMQDREIQLEMVEFDLCEVIISVLKSLEYDAKEKSLSLHAKLPSDKIVCDVLDKTKIKQVLTNLVHNAIKFTPDNGIITITLKRKESGLTIKVKDSGVGIPKSEYQKIFEQFYQIDGSSTRGVGGSGVGLSIARKYVELHGGSISVASKVGKGSTFSVTLPVTKESA